jgi:hypothetical protein
MASTNLILLTKMAERLRPLLGEVVFVGGCVTDLLITDAAAAKVRPTIDVDVIVIASYSEYVNLSERLRKLGFKEDASSKVLCRWLIDDMILDVMLADHWVAYVSDESGRYEIYVRRFSPEPAAEDSDTGGKWQVSYGGAHEPQWSADGKELYYLTLDWRVMVVQVSTNPVFKAGTPKLLFQAPQQPDPTVGDYTVDGKRFLFLAPTEQTGQAPFTVVLNWPSLLTK